MSNLSNNHDINLIKNEIRNLNVKCYDIKNFKDSKQIGRGAFATVYCAKLEDSNSSIIDVALKLFKNDDNESIMALAREIRLHMIVDMHDRIIKFYSIAKKEASLFEPGRYVLMLELADGSTLRDYLKNNISLNWYNKFCLAQQLAEAIKHMHSANIVHRDLYSKNILVHKNNIKIADFGLSRCLADATNTMTELASVLMWEISSGRPPLEKLHEASQLLSILVGHKEIPVEGMPPQYSAIYIDCWEDDPEKRPTIVQVVNWLEKITLEDTFSNIKRSERLGKYLNDIESFDYLQFSDFRLIARSENARVYSAIFQGKKYAIKCLYNNMKRDDTEFKSFIRELKPLSMIDHPNIVKFYSTSNVNDNVILVLQHANEGNLQVYLLRKRRDNLYKIFWNELIRIAMEIVNRGTPVYINPQYLKHEKAYKHDKKSDIYSLGILLWELTSGVPPFSNHQFVAVVLMIINNHREEVIAYTPSDYANIYKQCWSSDPDERLTVCDVLTKLKNISIETSIEFITNNMNNNKSEDQCNMSYTEPQTEHRNLNDDSSDDIAGNSNM
ncbi:kinase-like domain-containing protein [Gigaspora rosea]|uniref:Kinase-like domain-containing protein n=1 Tax=Gigaspora rosea TaxID=44941 RepID=A0A397V6K2_9GLOM|nr:kinase-like domain-containing protein [Gigaspora rosea]